MYFPRPSRVCPLTDTLKESIKIRRHGSGARNNEGGLTPSCTPGTPGYTVQYDALLYLLSFSCIYNDVHRSLNGAKRTVFPLLGSLLRTKTKFLMSPSLYVWSLAPLQQLVCQRSSTNSKRIITNFVGNAEYAISNAECSHGNIFASY